MAAEACRAILRCAKQNVERKIGKHDGTCRIGCLEFPIWLADRAFRVACRSVPNTTWYSTNEAAFLTGVTREIFLRIAPPAPAILVSGNLSAKPRPLWPEIECYDLRRRIKSGSIKVHWSSLTRPVEGVLIQRQRRTMPEYKPAEISRKRKTWSGLPA
jgi:hypothetical protein